MPSGNTEKIDYLRWACSAALARISGEYDNQDLISWGPLSTSTAEDAEQIMRDGLALASGNGCEETHCRRRIEPGFRFCYQHLRQLRASKGK